MYEKNLNISLLLDFYGELLTDKQRDSLEYYYNEDMSLAEIAEHIGGITRQGVRDAIKRGEQIITDFEIKLGLAAKFEKQRADAQAILELTEEISNINMSRVFNPEITEKTTQIVTYANSIIK